MSALLLRVAGRRHPLERPAHRIRDLYTRKRDWLPDLWEFPWVALANQRGGREEVWGMLHRRVLVVSLLMACGLVLAGCDALYDIVLENGTDREVTVSLLDTEVLMRRCSVLSMSLLGPASSSPVPVQVKDQAGNIVHSTTIKAGRHGRGNPSHVPIPPQEPGECPEPIDDRYWLIVANSHYEDVEVWYRGESLGWVSVGERERFGPLSGTWRDVHEVTVRTAGAKEKPVDTWGFPSMDYDLGEVPEVLVSVHEFEPS